MENDRNTTYSPSIAPVSSKTVGRFDSLTSAVEYDHETDPKSEVGVRDADEKDIGTTIRMLEQQNAVLKLQVLEMEKQNVFMKFVINKLNYENGAEKGQRKAMTPDVNAQEGR